MSPTKVLIGQTYLCYSVSTGKLEAYTNKGNYSSHIEYTFWVDHDRLLHKADGPAFEWVDTLSGATECQYYQHGNLHRLDGPAVDSTLPAKVSYWILNKKYSKKEYLSITSNVSLDQIKDIKELTEIF